MTTSKTDKLQKSLLGKLQLKSILLVETGLHIGGGGENLNIGGLDKPVIRDPLTQYPYLPGSSIKGKLRSILERVLNKPLNRKGSRDTYRYESDDLVDGVTKIDGQFVKFQGARTCELSRIFGSTGVSCWVETDVARSEGLLEDKSPKETIDGKEYANIKGRNAPARLIVRDCHLLQASIDALEKIDTGLYMTEWKFENGLDRITSAANPRQLERVPKGAKFHFEMVYTVENADQARTDLKNLLRAVLILEDDALGGHGSRGYGKVKFQNLEFCYRDYQGIDSIKGSSLSLPSPTKLPSPVKDTSELPGRFDEIQGLLPGN
jgi:CRISPR-associated protein Csm3